MTGTTAQPESGLASRGRFLFLAGWFNHALAQTRQGNDLDAAIAYRQALRFDPRSSDALNNLGWSLGRLGFRSEARESLTRALILRPDFELAQNNLKWVDSLK